MENIKNTTKYFKALGIILIAVAFVMALPVSRALADDAVDATGDTLTAYTDGGHDTGVLSNDTVDYTDGGNDTGIFSNDTVDYTDGGYDTGVFSNDGSVQNYSNQIVYTYTTTVEPSNYSAGYAIYSGAPSYGYNYYGNPVRIGYSNYPITIQQPIQVQPATSSNIVYPQPVTYYTQPAIYYNQPTAYYSQPAVTSVPNQVQAYNDTPNVSSVYLSDVPYTGFTDDLPEIIFILSLVLWSAILAYIFLKRKIDAQNSFAIAYAKNPTKAKNSSEDSVTSDLLNKIASDNSDISKVEEYARINKVLLSSDASAKLVKLSRLGKINASDYIRSVATGEWTAIGESQIK